MITLLVQVSRLWSSVNLPFFRRSSVGACSKVDRSRNVSDLKLGLRLGFVVDNNAAGMGIMLFFLY